MKKKNSEISFYVDMMIAETILANDDIIKTAQLSQMFDFNSIGDWITGYVKEHYNENDKVGSLVNFVMPGIVASLLGGPLGFLVGFLMDMFDVDTMGALRTAYKKFEELLSTSNGVSAPQIDQIVSSSVDEHSGAAVEKAAEVNQYSILKANPYAKKIRQAKLLKLDLIAYQNGKPIISNAGIFSFITTKVAGKNILKSILSFIFKVIFKSAAVMVAADVANKVLDRPSGLTPGSLQKSREERDNATSMSTQTKFKKNLSYSDNQLNSVHITNNKENIEQIVIDAANEVYQGLEDQDSNIKSCNNFNILVENIVWYNRKSVGDPVVFIPPEFNSKKKMADTFMDQLSQKAS